MSIRALKDEEEMRGVPFGIEFLCILVLCLILGDVPAVAGEYCSSFKSISHILVIFTILLAHEFLKGEP